MRFVFLLLLAFAAVCPRARAQASDSERLQARATDLEGLLGGFDSVVETEPDPDANPEIVDARGRVNPEIVLAFTWTFKGASQVADRLRWLSDLMLAESSEDVIRERCGTFLRLRVAQEDLMTQDVKKIIKVFKSKTVSEFAQDVLSTWQSAMDLMEEVCVKHRWEPSVE